MNTNSYSKMIMIGSAVFLALIVWAMRPTEGEVTLLNSTNQEIVGGTVLVSDVVYRVHHLHPFESQTFRIGIQKSSGYEVALEFGSSTKVIYKPIGYVTHGLNSRDVLRVMNSKLDLERFDWIRSSKQRSCTII